LIVYVDTGPLACVYQQLRNNYADLRCEKSNGILNKLLKKVTVFYFPKGTKGATVERNNSLKSHN